MRASAGATSSIAGRKKKITRRVGYARDADAEAPQEKAAAPQPRAPAAAPASFSQGAGFEPPLQHPLCDRTGFFPLRPPSNPPSLLFMWVSDVSLFLLLQGTWDKTRALLPQIMMHNLDL